MTCDVIESNKEVDKTSAATIQHTPRHAKTLYTILWHSIVRHNIIISHNTMWHDTGSNKDVDTTYAATTQQLVLKYKGYLQVCIHTHLLVLSLSLPYTHTHAHAPLSLALSLALLTHKYVNTRTHTHDVCHDYTAAGSHVQRPSSGIYAHSSLSLSLSLSLNNTPVYTL